ncbi:hypothetical protein PSHT_15309 [Puccinia striiformis]|uniref:Uncharacterized protein n=1 Tax=Puccinia striiformis TaxID=27350 RepID=A0A2S4UFQ8_9BASI|nr:hypothetical protein PSHT_15309 [Puccinia striiformis]
MVYPSYPYMTTTPPTNQAPPVYYYPYPEPYPHVIASNTLQVGNFLLVPLHRRPVLPHLELHLNFSLPQLIPRFLHLRPRLLHLRPRLLHLRPRLLDCHPKLLLPLPRRFPRLEAPLTTHRTPHRSVHKLRRLLPLSSLPLEFVRLCSSERRTFFFSTNFVARPSQFILTSLCLILFSLCISLVSLSGHTAPKPMLLLSPFSCWASQN